MFLNVTNCENLSCKVTKSFSYCKSVNSNSSFKFFFLTTRVKQTTKQPGDERREDVPLPHVIPPRWRHIPLRGLHAGQGAVRGDTLRPPHRQLLPAAPPQQHQPASSQVSKISAWVESVHMLKSWSFIVFNVNTDLDHLKSILLLGTFY